MFIAKQRVETKLGIIQMKNKSQPTGKQCIKELSITNYQVQVRLTINDIQNTENDKIIYQNPKMNTRCGL